MRFILLLPFLAPGLAHGADGARLYLAKPAEWYAGEDACRIADNILSHQANEGGWQKNTNIVAKPYEGDRARIKGTFDNGATTDELRFLAKMFNATKREKYRDSFLKGYGHILKAQYPNGGWPQYYPVSEKAYARHITFNDDSMVRLMRFLRESYTEPAYAFVPEEGRKAFDKGVECILKCQVVVDGKPTAWCAQHDAKDFSPQSARSYELVSISGAESVRIVELLMGLEKPSPEVVKAVDAAIAWFEAAKLKGIRQQKEKGDNFPKGWNKIVVKDASAPPLWARFYEIGTNKPIFCDRDGEKKYDMAEIGYERRNGYSWLGEWPAKLLAEEYPKWKARNP